MQTPLGTPRALCFSQLSIGRQTLVRLCQQTNYGFIRDLDIEDREPVFDPFPAVVVDLKLDGGDTPRLESALPDFQLPTEMLRLLDILDDVTTAKVESIEVRAGIPRRVLLRASLPRDRSDLGLGERISYSARKKLP